MRRFCSQKNIRYVRQAKRHAHWFSRRCIAKLVTFFQDCCAKGCNSLHKPGKAPKQNFERNSKLTDHDRRVLKRIVTRKHKTTLPQIILKMNIHKQNPVYTKTIKQKLQAANIRVRMAIRKTLHVIFYITYITCIIIYIL